MVERETLVALVRGLQNGDESAAAQLYEIYQNDIYYFILKTVNNDKDLAEDLTQDTFVEILETIDKLQEPAAFVTWSKQIAYHKCTAYFRKRKELLVDEDEDGYSVFDTIEEENEEFIPDAAMDKEDLKQTIVAMLDALSEEQRSAILLRYFNEISVKEIAQIQGVTEGTVKSRLNYGRKAIKQSVEQYEKKTGVKLHCAGVLPLLLWMFREYRISKGLSVSEKAATQAFEITGETAATAVAATSVAAATAATAATASGAAATATVAAAEVAVGAGIKIAGTSLATKVIAGITAATVALGGATVGKEAISKLNANKPAYTETQEVLPTQMTLPYEETLTPVETTQLYYPESTVAVEATEPANCEHVWELYASHTGIDFIERTYICANCGAMDRHVEENQCQHEWKYITRTEEDYVYEDRYCYWCRTYEMCSKYPIECEHDWILQWEMVGATSITEEYVCRKCNAVDSVWYLNTCEHEWQVKGEVQNGESVATLWKCTKCRLESYDPQQNPNASEESTPETEGTEGTEPPIEGTEPPIEGTEPPTEAPTEAPSDATGCEHDWKYNTWRDEIYVYEDRSCKKCGRFENYSKTEYHCEHEWVGRTAVDVSVIYEYEDCTKCQLVRFVSERENPCEHTWNIRTFADPVTVCRQEECTNCTAVKNTWEHQWEEQTVVDENGEIIDTRYYCPICTAYQ